MDLDWTPHYNECSCFGEWWKISQDPDKGPWPEGMTIRPDGKMDWQGRLCVPMGLTGRVIRAHHISIGHVGGTRLWKEMRRWYNWAEISQAEKISKEVTEGCEKCQAHAPPVGLVKGPIEATPILPHIGTSVAIDIFEMPNVKWEGKEYDCMAICVDRHSEWCVVTPIVRRVDRKSCGNRRRCIPNGGTLWAYRLSSRPTVDLSSRAHGGRLYAPG